MHILILMLLFAQDAYLQELSRAEIIKEDLKRAIKDLGSQWPTQIDKARSELLELGKQAIGELITALKDPKPSVRFNACEILGELRAQTAIYAIAQLLEDPDEYGISIAACAARSLGKIASSEAIPYLIEALKAEKVKLDVELRYELITALGKLRATKAKDLIKKYLDDKSTTYLTKKMVMFAALDALGKLRANELVDEIAKILDDKSTKEEWSAQTAQLKAAEVLQRITKNDFGPILEPEDEKTKQTLKKWQEWWQARKKKKEEEKRLKEAREKTKNAIKDLVKALELFRANEGRYPEKLQDLLKKPPYAKKWKEGGYLKKLPKDGWGKDFIYKIPGTAGEPFDLISYGADGKEGGSGKNEDIWNHQKWKVLKDQEAIKKTKKELEKITQALELFKKNEGRYPEKLLDLLKKPPYAKKWKEGGYLKELPKDGWGRNFIYKSPGTAGEPFELVSYGADGKEGGEGPAKDIKAPKR